MPYDNCPALVLNADFRPLSYFPLSLWSWQDAVKAVFLGRVNIISEYDRTVRSPNFERYLPPATLLWRLCAIVVRSRRRTPTASTVPFHSRGSALAAGEQLQWRAFPVDAASVTRCSNDAPPTGPPSKTFTISRVNVESASKKLCFRH